ncbi:MAG: TIGR03862 family flavoprotein [Hyphomonadaceae bacterium]|nr:TIGR03862 family flavoprotein [Hyphomonadaceae bacterium]
MSDAHVAIIGAGPAGLIAAEILSAAGKRVVVYERMPSVARKFLMAGRGGLNLTHSEEFERFLTRYRDSASRLRPILEGFTHGDLVAWANGLGAETFVGSSGRVFPAAMKASPLLRAWLTRLAKQGVEIRTRVNWLGWEEDGALRFNENGKQASVRTDATLFALGGASWPRLGADGSWRDPFEARGVEVALFQPANVGYTVAWSDHFRSRFAGQALKNIAIRHLARTSLGEAMITAYGIEGGAIYALTSELRAAAPTGIRIDLRPDLRPQHVIEKLTKAKPGDTLSSTLRKSLNLPPVAVALLYENGPPPRDPEQLTNLIKAIPITLNAPHGIDRAISSAGGVTWNAVDENLQLRVIPDAYVAGEMLDWEAPTGGYLLQACFATGVHAARAILRR